MASKWLLGYLILQFYRASGHGEGRRSLALVVSSAVNVELFLRSRALGLRPGGWGVTVASGVWAEHKPCRLLPMSLGKAPRVI